MKNIKEILQESGIELSEEQTSSIEKSVLENYKTTAEFEKLKEKSEKVEEKNTEIQTAFDEFKKNYEDVNVEEMKTKIETLNKSLEESNSKYENHIKTTQFMELAKAKASELGCADFDLAMKALDMDALLTSKDQSKDIETALTELKENKPILFTKEEEKPKDNINLLDGVEGKVGDSDAQMRAVMGLPPIKEE